MRVLSVDGGGVRGIVPSTILAAWEMTSGRRACEAADLFVGTSTGAIVAAALALGLAAERIMSLFHEHAANVFSREGLTLSQRVLTFKGWALPAYSPDALERLLFDILGDAPLSECPRPLSIPAMDVVTGEPKVFRSPHHREGKLDAGIRVVDAVLASTAAPVLFPSVRAGGSTYVDGSLWAVNPSLVAVLDARDLGDDTSFDAISLVSLGCGAPVWSGRQGFGARRGLAGWGGPLPSLALAGQAAGVHAHVGRLLAENRYLRIDPTLPRGLKSLDSAANLPDLVVRAGMSARERMNDLNRLLAD